MSADASSPTVPSEDVDGFLQTRKSLIDRLDDWQDQEAWQRFYNTYWRVIHRFALQAGLRSDEAFDVVQETILTIAKQAKDQRYDRRRGSFKSWLFNQTRWRIADRFRQRGREVNVGGDEEGSARTPVAERLEDPSIDLDACWDEEWQQNAMEHAVAVVRKQVAPRQFQIFDCAVLREWPVEKVKKELGISAAQVYLARHRVTREIRKEVEKLERSPF